VNAAPPTLRERRSEKRKLEILEAALEVLSEDGYSSASMDKIAERALLTRVGLYKHFRDKVSLVIALRQHKLLEIADVVQNAVALETDFEGQLRAAVRETVRYQTENQGFFRVLLASGFSSDLTVDHSLKPYLGVLAAIFALGAKQKRIQADPWDCAGLLATLAFSPSIKRAFVPLELGYTPPEHLADLITNVFLHGVMQRAPAARAKRNA
jgi:AcrR family transcriptional regulator